MKTLFLSDLDGTLLNEKAQISNKTACVLNSLLSKGMLFTVATARTYSTVIPIFKDVKLNLPLILMNGVCIFDPVHRKTIGLREMSFDTARSIDEIFKKHNKTPMIYFERDDHITVEYMKLNTKSQKDYVAERKSFYNKEFIQVKSFSFGADDKPIYAVTLDNYAQTKAIYDDVKKLENVTCHFYSDNYCDDYFLEIFAKNTSKKSGALKLKELTQADRIVAFGDNLNDSPLFEIADEAYATANACDELKSIATGVIGSNREDAVAVFLEQNYNRYI